MATGTYEQWASTSPMVRCLWRAEVGSAGTWVDPATEYWGVAFGETSTGDRTAELIGPSLAPRALALSAGERSWGIELHAHVFWRGVDKLPLRGELRPLPMDGDFFVLAGARYPVPPQDGMERLVDLLTGQGVLVSDPHVARALAGDDPHLSERSMQRLFGRATGLRRVQISQLRRAAHAYLLLQEGTPITRAAAEAGFSDQAHLTRAMRGFVGRTPARILAEFMDSADGGNIQDPATRPGTDFSP